MTEIPSTPVADPGARRRGIRASAQRVVAHLRALLQLERELARAEMQRKGAKLGAGAGVAVAAGLLVPFAVGFGLAALAAGLALVVDWWLSLLIVFALLVVVVLVLVLVARFLFRRGTPLKPEQAIEELQLTKQTLRGSRAG
jgi:Flp pilus assembly protein TadB